MVLKLKEYTMTSLDYKLSYTTLISPSQTRLPLHFLTKTVAPLFSSSPSSSSSVTSLTDLPPSQPHLLFLPLPPKSAKSRWLLAASLFFFIIGEFHLLTVGFSSSSGEQRWPVVGKSELFHFCCSSNYPFLPTLVSHFFLFP